MGRKLLGTIKPVYVGAEEKPDGKTCPNGHVLPYEHQNGRCSPNKCGAAREPTAAMTDKAALRKGGGQEAQVGLVRRDEKQKQSFAVTRRDIRNALVPVPKLEGPDVIEAYADKKAVELLPEALAVLEYNLKYGDEKERTEAMHDVLDMNGRRKREALGQGSQTIVLNFGGGGLPWETAKVVDVQRPSNILSAKNAENAKNAKGGK